MEESQHERTSQELQRIQIRESQLWSLALLIICLLVITIIALDMTGTERTTYPDPVSLALDSRATRVFLLLASLLITAYFREKTRELRKTNGELMEDLLNKSENLAQSNEQLRRTQAELVQTAKLASIGQLAGGVAHEINNPLTVILGRAQLLLLDCQDPQACRNLEVIASETERISGIVKNLLSFSRQSGDRAFEPVSLVDVLRRTLDLANYEDKHADVQVELLVEPGVGEVLGSAGQLQQVFTNIVINAFQAMPEGGSLRISAWQDGSRTRVSFADSGKGMDEGTLQRIFDPFFTTKDEGTGLGLSVSYGIIRDHGGKIEVTSKPGIGTTFTVSLPTLAAGEAKAA